MPIRVIAVGLAFTALALSGCSAEGGSGMSGSPAPAGDSGTALPAGAVITYEFTDSSVPPPYHRSFVLTVSETSARIVVDSYGDVLADESASVPSATWDALATSYRDLGGIVIVEPEQGCTGGTNFAVTVTVGDAVLRDLSGYVCGGANAEADVQVRKWIAPARALFPPMSELAPEGG